MASPSGSSSSNPFAGPADPAPPAASTLVLINIRNHVPVILSSDDGNFRQWWSFFDLTFKKFDLVSHVDGSVAIAAMLNDPEWLHRLTPAYSWLYSTVSKEIWSDVYKPSALAYTAWTAITRQFLDHSLQRTVYAQQEFHSLFQGDMTIGEYCGRLKRLANNPL